MAFFPGNPLANQAAGDVLFCVFPCLAPKELAHCSQSSTHLYQATNADAVWVWHCKRLWAKKTDATMPPRLFKMLQTAPKQTYIQIAFENRHESLPDNDVNEVDSLCLIA